MGVLLEECPRTGHVRLGRPQVANREAEHELTVEARVREEYFAARVHAFEQLLVAFVRHVGSEADHAEGGRCHRGKVGMILHPLLEQPCQTDMFG